MKENLTERFAFAIAILLLAGASAVAQSPLGSEFTYQGKLDRLGSPINDTADFQFTLWDARAAGNIIGSPLAARDVWVADGLFTVELDFGVMAFNGDNRWLEVGVRSPAGGGGRFTTLRPRQPLTAIPYALQTRGIVVDAVGNVGIGTALPTDRLTVVGNAHFTRTISALRYVGDGSALTGAYRPAYGPDINKIALLHWHLINVGHPVGDGPRGVAFDGANIWVANYDGNNVTKLRASDGANLGTFSVGFHPYGVAFDGANIWVANWSSGTVTKLRASDGANLGTVPAGTWPAGVAFDGANIWVTNYGSDDVTRIWNVN